MDQIIDIAGTKIATEKRVKSNEFFFKGHYPGNPIMPGVLVCEAVFQSGAILVTSTYKNSDTPATELKGVPVLTRIKDVKFKNIVRPNDILQIEVELAEKIGGACFMKGVARVDGKVAVRVEFAVTIANID